jgi:hypothetical protein
MMDILMPSPGNRMAVEMVTDAAVAQGLGAGPRFLPSFWAQARSKNRLTIPAAQDEAPAPHLRARQAMAGPKMPKPAPIKILEKSMRLRRF